MKKVLTICLLFTALSITVYAAEKSVPVSPSISTTEAPAPTPSLQTEYDYAKANYDRMMEGLSLSKDELLLVGKYFDLSERPCGGSLDAVAGPDSGYYYYVDNTGTDSVIFNWIELKGDPSATWLLGTAFTGTLDDGYTTTAINLGFSFPIYGSSYPSVRVGTNGNLQFATSVTGGYSTCLPASSFNAPTLFPYLQDQDLRRGRGTGNVTGDNVVGYRNFGDYTVIEWDSTGRYGTGTLCSFNYQAILWSTGLIKFQYRRMYFDAASTSYDSAGTIGIQRRTTSGYKLQYVCNKVGWPIGGVGLPEIVNRAVVFYQQLPAIAELGVVSMTPCGPLDLNIPPQTISLRVSNAGGAASSPVTAYFSFDNGAVTGSAPVPAIAANSFFDVFFSPPVAMTPGSHTLSGWFLPHDNPAVNDSMACTITVARLCASCTPEDVVLDPVPTTPWAGSLSANCGNAGKWVGSFVAQSGWTYHFDLCPNAPG